MRRAIIPLLALPAVMVVVFLILAGTSFFEIRAKKNDAAPMPPTRPDFAVRYRDETAALKQLRDEARKDLSAEKILASFTQKEIPSARTIVTWSTALCSQEPGAADELLVGLLPLWKKYLDHAADKARFDAVEDLLVQTCLTATERLMVTPNEREDLLCVLEDAAMGRRKVAGAVVLLLGRIGQRDDAPRLQDIANKLANSQVKLQVQELVAELAKKELVKA